MRYLARIPLREVATINFRIACMITFPSQGFVQIYKPSRPVFEHKHVYQSDLKIISLCKCAFAYIQCKMHKILEKSHNWSAGFKDLILGYTFHFDIVFSIDHHKCDSEVGYALLPSTFIANIIKSSITHEQRWSTMWSRIKSTKDGVFSDPECYPFDDDLKA